MIPNMVEESLWTPADGEAVKRCRAAVNEHDLATALLEVEHVNGSMQDTGLATLGRWADEVRAGLKTSSEVVRVLQEVLVERHGLKGEGEDFYDPRNCYLTEVIARRRGMPILLSSIWLIVARMVGIEAHGIGMPGHFIIRVGSAGRGQLIDPFGGGRALSIDRCATIVNRLSGLDWDPDFLSATSDESIVTRVARNLQICHHRRKARMKLYRMARFNALLMNHCPAAQLLHGQVAEMIDLEPLAVPIYRALINEHPKTSEAKVALDRIRALEFEGPDVH